MINFKQQELSEMLCDKLKKKFSDLEFVDIMESPENPNHIWVNIIMPEDDEKQLAIYKQAGKISTDILMKYGYMILISAAAREEKSAV
jgi:mitochondrial fission protein ELM1